MTWCKAIRSLTSRATANVLLLVSKSMLDGSSTYVTTTRGRDEFIAEYGSQTLEIKTLRQERETELQAGHHRSMFRDELLVLDAVSG